MISERIEREIDRRRRTLFRYSVIIGPLVLLGLSGVGVSTQSRPRRRCAIDFGVFSDEPSTGTTDVPCDFEQVSVSAPWRWPVVATGATTIILIIALLWLLQPRMVAALAAAPQQESLTGSERRSSIRYRILPHLRWMYVGLGVVCLVPGLLLLVLPSGAPAVVGIGLLGFGTLLLASLNHGTVEVNATHLSVRRTLWWSRWPWEDIVSISSVDVPLGRARMVRRALSIERRNGATFVDFAFSSPPSVFESTRTDRIVRTLREQTRSDTSSSVSNSTTA